SEIMTQFKVSITPTAPAVYMIIDLTQSPGAAGQIEYVYEDDLHAGTYGAVETNFVAGIESLIWTGVTNNSAYKEQKMVLRRVSAGSVTPASGSPITVSKDFYIAVFETTQNQWMRIDGAYPASGYTGNRNRPVEKIASYERLRGSTADGVNWPSTGDCVSPSSFVAQTRDKTGVSGFDLPNNSQWQYACRAGTSTIFNDNASDATTAEINGTNQWLHVLGRYKGNASGIPSVVGSYKPNAWGIYDMHGNVQEWTLDWYAVGSQRTRRGGSWLYEAGRCFSGFSNGTVPNDTDNFYVNGFRFIINLEP
ncbi:MAG: SUMF1/EgtB/PvdO family nonheme iron enzyme, partial [Kiritimatiellae bacterium]|nr:SUMF1/EgtB/PvdO family nonheme iron enzyme [Kiritimatiellia bacterium]